MYFGNVCHSVVPPPARPTPGRTQATTSSSSSSSDVKPRLSFRLLPGFPDMDHIHKALIGSGFGQVSPLKRKANSCRVCRLRFNTEAQVSSHNCSAKHAKRLKSLDPSDPNIKTLTEPPPKEVTSQSLSSTSSQPCSYDATTSGEPSAPDLDSETSPSNVGPPETSKAPPEPAPSPCPGTSENREAAPEGETEEEKAIRLLYCSLCKVAVNSASQLQAHNSGTKHKTMLEARSGDGAIKSFPRVGVKSKLAVPPESSTGLQNKTFHCEICDVHVNSETQLKQHISSRRHKDRAAGKPAKPKFSPYTLGQRHHSFQSLRLALQKTQDLTKPLASCLIQRQLSVAAAMASLPPLPLRPASNSCPALFQSHPLPHALLHPAPGPMCSTHTQVLFSPY